MFDTFNFWCTCTPLISTWKSMCMASGCVFSADTSCTITYWTVPMFISNKWHNTLWCLTPVLSLQRGDLSVSENFLFSLSLFTSLSLFGPILFHGTLGTLSLSWSLSWITAPVLSGCFDVPGCNLLCFCTQPIKNWPSYLSMANPSPAI